MATEGASSVRIVHVITGLGDGGAEGVLFRLCAQGGSFSHVVVSLTTEGKYGPRLRDLGVAVYTLDQRPGSFSLAAVLRLARLLRCTRPDVIQTWMYHADLVGGFLGRLIGRRPVCWNVRNSDLSPMRSSMLTRYVVKLCAGISGWVPSRIVCCAHKAADVHVAIGYRPSRFTIIPNGIDTTRFSPDRGSGLSWREAHGVPRERALLGMVARSDPQKDHENLLEALRIVRDSGWDFLCVLAGSGVNSTNTSLRAAVRRCGLDDRVMLLGATDQVAELMNAIDLHVLSSAYGEAFPNVVAEAMACATPNVVTDVGDSRRIVGDTGWTVPRSDPTALAGAITMALKELADPYRWPDRCLAANRRVMEHYTLDRMVEGYEALWFDLIRKRRPSW